VHVCATVVVKNDGGALEVFSKLFFGLIVLNDGRDVEVASFEALQHEGGEEDVDGATDVRPRELGLRPAVDDQKGLGALGGFELVPQLFR